MSLATLKRKTSAKYGNHTNVNGFSLNGTSRYPSYVGRDSINSRSGVKQGNVCCAYETPQQDGFKTVKNYNAIHKHGRLTGWTNEDYTQAEWNAAIATAGLTIDDYPYPAPGTIEKKYNNWVQKSIHGDANSHIYTHNKKNTVLRQEFECKQKNINEGIPIQKLQCISNSVITETGILKHRCVPITKDIEIGKDSSNSLERIKYIRGGLNPRGYSKPFPYNTQQPGYKVCKTNENQALDALKNGYFSGQTYNKCGI